MTAPTTIVPATLKTITLTQPWASLVAGGHKKLETRAWRVAYRGPLAIHAAKSMPDDAYLCCFQEPYRAALRAMGIEHPGQLVLGAVVATCTLRHCLPTEKAAPNLSYRERAFGDYTPGRWAWLLEEVRPLPRPIPAKGSLGLWTWAPPEGVTLP